MYSQIESVIRLHSTFDWLLLLLKRYGVENCITASYIYRTQKNTFSGMIQIILLFTKSRDVGIVLSLSSHPYPKSPD